MLKAEGSYILPENVPANEFLNLEGKKLSTSKNWAVWLHEYLQDFPEQQDVLRYVLTANAPETKDNDFTWKDFQARNNNELVAVFGNFINRVLVLTDKYYAGEVPSPGNLSEVDKHTLATLKAYPAVIASSIEKYRFREAQGELMNLARLGNKYLADEEPWKMIKTDAERVKTVMYIALQISSALATLSEPFLPFTSAKLRTFLSMEQEATSTPGNQANSWNEVNMKEVLLPAGHHIGKAELLFSKIEDEQIERQLEKLEATKAANIAENKTVEPQKEMATFEDFSKMDLRAGTIVDAVKMPKADKLLVLKVDTGLDIRTIVSGIAKSFKPEEIIGKKVTVLINLAPRKLRGVESQGMILMTESSNGKVVFLNPDTEDVDNGSVIS
jgi:methionyl-tRNA synthetase